MTPDAQPPEPLQKEYKFGAEYLEDALLFEDARARDLYQYVIHLCEQKTSIDKTLVLVSERKDVTELERCWLTWKLAERFFGTDMAEFVQGGIKGRIGAAHRLARHLLGPMKKE